MTENSRTVAAVKGQLSKFTAIISEGLPKAKQRLVGEMIYGIAIVSTWRAKGIKCEFQTPR